MCTCVCVCVCVCVCLFVNTCHIFFFYNDFYFSILAGWQCSVHLLLYIFFFHSSVYRWTLRLLPILATVNSAAVNIGVHVSFLIRVFTFSGYMSRNETERGSWAQKPFCVPHFWYLGNSTHSASMTFPEFLGTGSDRCWSGKEGDAKTREETVKTQ